MVFETDGNFASAGTLERFVFGSTAALLVVSTGRHEY